MTRPDLIQWAESRHETLAAMARRLKVSRQHVHQLLHREERLARLAVYRAVRAGRLERPTRCSRCRVECRPEAHHGDYALRLAVEWLCRACHVSVHVGRRRAA